MTISLRIKPPTARIGTRLLMITASLAVMSHAVQAAETPSQIDDRLSRLGSSNAEAPPAQTPAASDTTTTADASAAAPKPAKRNAQPSLRSIEERLQRLEAKTATAATPATTAAAPAASSSSDVKVEFSNLRPTFKSADGRNELAIRGLAQFDVAAYSQDPSDQGAAVPTDHRDLGSGALFRRVRLGVEGKFMQDFIYEMRFEFGGSDAEGTGTIDIMRVGYTGIPNLRVQLGVMQPILSMADPQPSSELTFLERPAVVTTVLPVFGGESQRKGVEATYQQVDVLSKGDNLILSGAFTGQKVGSAHSGGSSLDDEGTQVLARAAYRIYSDEDTNIQLGMDVAEIVSLQGTTANGARNVRFRERPEVRVSGERLVDTGDIPADGGSMFGLEGGANFQNFYIGGEWYQFDLDRDRNCGTCNALAGDPDFSGWYIEGTWVITGESRRYLASGNNNSIGTWAGPKVKEPFGVGDGIGAFEAMARYSTLDLDWNEGTAGNATPTGGIRGGEQSIFALGLIWYLNSNLRIMTDYQWVDIDRLNSAGVDAGQDFQVIQSRAQFTF